MKYFCNILEIFGVSIYNLDVKMWEEHMKNFLKVMIIFMGIVLGSYLGELALGVSWLKFLSFGKDIGFAEPISLDLGFLQITFGFLCKLNLASILGFIIAFFVIKKVVK